MTTSNAAIAASTSRFPRVDVVRAFARRDFLTARSYRLSFVLETLFGFLELAVYFFISRVVAGVASEPLEGAPSYFAFAAVGVIVGAILAAVTTTIGLRLREEQLTGTMEVLAAQPATTVELCVGLVSFPFVFSSLRAAVYLLVASFWMNLDASQTSWAGVAVMLVVSGLALSPLGILSCALVLLYKRGALLGGALIYAMTLLGGAVFPLAVLPTWLEWIGRAMPVRFAFDGVRAALFTGDGWAVDALALACWGIVLTPAALLAFSAALRHAKKNGSLSEY
jgi:ABC-2 type transport system permease protein